VPLWTTRTDASPHPSRLLPVWSPLQTDLTDLDTQTKLWGTEADLGATAQSVTSTDLRIWCRRRRR
jgi:hypothetical protein